MKKVVATILLTTFITFAMAQKGTVGSLSNNDKQVAFFPNPATTIINFEFKNPVEKGSVLEVYSFLGRRMANINVAARRITITLNEYVTGIYVFQLRDAAGRVVETNKFQVAK